MSEPIPEFSYKSVWYRDEKPFAFEPDTNIPHGFSMSDERPYPGNKQFYCPRCNLRVTAEGFAAIDMWHYRGICPQCGHKWSKLSYRFRKTKAQKEQEAKTVDWDASADP